MRPGWKEQDIAGGLGTLVGMLLAYEFKLRRNKTLGLNYVLVYTRHFWSNSSGASGSCLLSPLTSGWDALLHLRQEMDSQTNRLQMAFATFRNFLWPQRRYVWDILLRRGTVWSCQEIPRVASRHSWMKTTPTTVKVERTWEPTLMGSFVYFAVGQSSRLRLK